MQERRVRLSTSGFVLFCLGSFALAACSSSGSKCCAVGTAGSDGGAAGSGGGSGAAGASQDGAAGALQDGAAGASQDAAAGGTGGADAGGTAGASVDGGASDSSDAAVCSYAASLGAATITMPSAVEGGDKSTLTLHDGSVAWQGQVNNNTMPDVLDVQLYENTAPFGAMLSSMSISLVGQDNFATCGACVLFHPQDNDGVPLHAQTNYIATAGTLNVTAVPNGTTMRFTASLSNVTFKHVTIDSVFLTTKVDDCTITLTSAAIDSPVTPAP